MLALASIKKYASLKIIYVPKCVIILTSGVKVQIDLKEIFTILLYIFTGNYLAMTLDILCAGLAWVKEVSNLSVLRQIAKSFVNSVTVWS